MVVLGGGGAVVSEVPLYTFTGEGNSGRWLPSQLTYILLKCIVRYAFRGFARAVVWKEISLKDSRCPAKRKTLEMCFRTSILEPRPESGLDCRIVPDFLVSELNRGDHL